MSRAYSVVREDKVKRMTLTLPVRNPYAKLLISEAINAHVADFLGLTSQVRSNSCVAR